MTKSWKEVEKRLTLWYNETHAPATRMSTGMRGEAVEDINWANRFSIEVKTRKKIPKYIKKWLLQTVRNSGTRYGIVHWHQDGIHAENDIVLMGAETFRYHMALLMAMMERIEWEATSEDKIIDRLELEDAKEEYENPY